MNGTRGRYAWVSCLAVTVATLAGGCSRSESAGKVAAQTTDGTAGVAAYREVTEAAGIGHVHFKPQLDPRLANINNWVASVGAAAAAGDFDNDGWIDLYVTNSRKGEPNYLYRNNGDGTFTDVAAAAGVRDVNGDDGVCMDCVWGDVDNDGHVDLYLVRWGRDVLFHNNGDGTFEDVTEKMFRRDDGSPGMEWANGNAAIFFDYNLDGLLDVYVGNYFDHFDLWHLPHTRIMHDDFEKARNGGRNALFRQQADGTFVDVAAELKVDDQGWTLAVGSADVNNDGWPDLYSADDFGPDQLFYNRGDGTFENVSESAIGFDTKKGMNAEFGDFNGDGWLDIYVANITTAEYLQEGNMLWHNNGPDADGHVTFTDIASETGTFDGGWGWGAKFFDYDNDGDLDLLAVNGFISAGEGNFWFDLASWTVLGEDAAEAMNWPPIGDRSFSGYEPFRFWRNEGMDVFTSRAKEVGLDSDKDGRGLVCFDYDNDGDIDLFVANQGQKPQLFRNDLVQSSHWLGISLDIDSSTEVNLDGIGTRVTVVTEHGTQIREREGGNGYSGQSDPRMHFGLAKADSVQLIEIRWPDGGLQYLENVPANQFVSIRQDPSQYVGRSLVAVAKPKSKTRSTHAQTIEVDSAEMDRFLSRLEYEIRSNPDRYGLTDSYRAQCVKWNKHDRSIDFFDALTREHPSLVQPGVAFAAAYIDKIPTCGGLAAVVSKGTLANKALDVMNTVLKRHGSSWVVHYARGMNHLHWPRMLRHSDDAAADFEKCLASPECDGSGEIAPYCARAYLALGDAWAKNKEYSKARSTWRKGIAQFPKAADLQTRIAITDDAKLDAFVMDARSLEKPIDTGFGFIERWDRQTNPVD